jgi:hypothetical protein
LVFRLPAWIPAISFFLAALPAASSSPLHRRSWALPQTWHAREIEGHPGRFTLENVTLLGAGVANRFLDGRTATGDVGLAPNTDPPFTGTVWDIGRVPEGGPIR